MKTYQVAVIGGGAAGIQAVLRSVLNNKECLFFPGSPKDKKRSRAKWVAKIENMPAHFHYKKGIEEPVKETLEWIQSSDFKENLIIQDNRGVTELKKVGELFELTDTKDEKYQAEFVILCTGVMDRQPEIEGSIKPILPYANLQSVDYCLRCDGHHVLGKKSGVIGYNNGALWVAIMLHERYQPPSMSIFTNGEISNFNGEALKLAQKYNFQFFEEKITAVEGVKKEGKLEAFVFTDGSKVELDICFVSLGMLVYNELAKSLGAKLDERGFVLTDDKGESSVEGLYIAGDLRAQTKKQVYTAWDTAVDAADAIDQKIRLKKRNS